MNRVQRSIFALCLLVLLGSMASIAFAQEVACPKVSNDRAHVCWSPVVTFTDGTPIPAGDVSYQVQQQTSSGWNTVASGLTATDWTSGVLQPGSYSYRVRAVVASVSSEAGPTGSKTVTSSRPARPSTTVVAWVSVTIPER